MNILKIADVGEDKIQKIFALADKAKSQKYIRGEGMTGKFLASLFFEPSTRTRLSFETAMKSLGGEVITVENAESSSVTKGETLRDTLMTVAQYSNIIVTRTSENLVADNLKSIPVPIINAGDGAGEHPTQALLDFYTIRNYFKGHFSILFLGDLENGRTIHSLIQLLARYNCTIFHHAPNNRKLPIELRGLSEDAEGTWETRILPNVDVVYCSREQKERTNKVDVQLYSMHYGLHGKNPSALKEEAIVMHPLPRGKEIPVSWDKDHRSVYFEQARNGVYVRMGIIMDLLL